MNILKSKVKLYELNNKFKFNYFFRHTLILIITMFVVATKLYWDNYKIIDMYAKLFLNEKIIMIFLTLFISLFYTISSQVIKNKNNELEFSKIYCLQIKSKRWNWLKLNYVNIIWIGVLILLHKYTKLNLFEFQISLVSYTVIFTLFYWLNSNKNKFQIKYVVTSVIWSLVNLGLIFYKIKYYSILVLFSLNLLVFGWDYIKNNIKTKKQPNLNKNSKFNNIWIVSFKVLLRENKLNYLIPILAFSSYFGFYLNIHNNTIFSYKFTIEPMLTQTIMFFGHFVIGVIIISNKLLTEEFSLLYYKKNTKIMFLNYMFIVIFNILITTMLTWGSNEYKETLSFVLVYYILIIIAIIFKYIMFLDKIYIGFPLVSLISVLIDVIIDKLQIIKWIDWLNQPYIYAILIAIISTGIYNTTKRSSKYGKTTI